NEPPLAYYRIPILGHTWRFYTDCKNLIIESREKYGKTFSLYVFGRVITVVGKDTSQEVLTSHKDFNFLKAMFELRHLDYIFKGQDFDNNKGYFYKKIKA
ncbi:3183_t:CDS:2, partial [Dentiscutata heterogama]